MKKSASSAVSLLSALAGLCLAALALSPAAHAQTTITLVDSPLYYTDVHTTTVADPLTFTIADGLATQSGPIGGDGSITKTGSGAISLAGANTYTGGTVVDAGILAIDNDGEFTFGTLGSGTTTINGDTGSGFAGTLQFLTNSSAGSGTFTLTGSTVGGGSGGSVEFYRTSTAGSGTFTAEGATASGTAGGFVIFLGSSTAGSATLIAHGSANAGAGGSIFFVEDSLGGTAAVKVFGNGFLDIGYHNAGLTIGSLEGTGQVFLGANNLTIGSNNTDTTFSGTVQDGGAAGGVLGALTKIGTGTLTLSGANTYTGGTTIAAGQITMGDAGALGTGAVSVASGATLDAASYGFDLGRISGTGTLTSSGIYTAAPASDVTLATNLTGTASLTKTGTGTLTLSGTNTYSGGTVLNDGILGLGADNALGTGTLTINGGNIRAANAVRTLTNNVTVNGDFTLGRYTTLAGAITLTADVTITSANPDVLGPTSSALGAISGAHSLTFTEGTNPVGTIILAGANTYTGGTTITAGNVQIGNGGTTGSIVGDVLDNGSLTFNRSDATTFAGVISGAGSVTHAGSGTLTLTGTNTYAGGTSVSGYGTIEFSNDANLGTGNITLNGGGLKWAAGNTTDISSRLNNTGGNAAIFDTNGNNVSFASSIAGDPGYSQLVKTGAGTLTLSGATITEFDVLSGTLAFGTGTYQSSFYIGLNSSFGLDPQNYGPSAVILSGPGTSFSSNLENYIGYSNEFSASLTISGGAAFSSTGYATYVGQNSAAESTMTVTGAGSTYTGSGQLDIGIFSSGRSTFIVSAGASATVSDTNLGYASSGDSIITVSGTGSLFTTTGTLTIGSGHGSSAVTISDGAVVSAGTTLIGYGAGSGANSLTLTGAGSKFTNTGSLTLADGASDNGTLNLGSAAGSAATAAGILDADTVTGGAGAAVLQFNTTGTDLAPTYFTRDGTSTGTGVNTTGGLSLVNTAGTTVLSGTGTQTGATIVNGGTLVVSQLANGGLSSSIGQSSSAATNLVLNGGALRYTGAAQSTNRLFQIGGTTAGGTGTLDASGTGALNLTNTGSVAYGTANQTRTLALTGTNTDANTLAAVIANNGTGAVSVTKSGAGTWALTGTNTYSGGTTITGGLVSFTTGANLGTGNITLDGGGLLWATRTLIDISSRLNPIGAGGATFAFDSANNNIATFASALTGSGGITKAGIGSLYLAAANTYLGPTTIRDGEVGVLNDGVNTFGTLGGGLTTIGEGRDAALTFYNRASAGNGTFIANGGGYVDFHANTTAASGTFTINGGAASDANGAGLYFEDNATAASAMITVNGGTASGATGGDVEVTGNSDLGTATFTVNGGTNGGLGGGITFYNDATGGTATVKLYGNGFLDLGPRNAGSVSVGSLEGTGNVFLGNTDLAVGSRNTNTTFSGVIAGGTGSFSKVGTGTLTLSGVNTYTGATAINAGKLIVDGSIANSAVTVNNGGTLGGHGTVGALTLASGSILAPGNSPGTLHAGDTTFAGDATLQFEINNATGTAGTNYDLLAITGTLTLNATSASPFIIDLTSLKLLDNTVGLAANFDPAANYSFTFLTTTGGITGFAADEFSIATTHFQNPFNGTWSVSSANSGHDLTLSYAGMSSVPEPSTYAALAGLAALALAAATKRRRHR